MRKGCGRSWFLDSITKCAFHPYALRIRLPVAQTGYYEIPLWAIERQPLVGYIGQEARSALRWCRGQDYWMSHGGVPCRTLRWQPWNNHRLTIEFSSTTSNGGVHQ